MSYPAVAGGDVIDRALVASAQELQALQQGNFNLACQRFRTFLNESVACVTEKGDDHTNVIDQGAAVTYSFDDERLAKLYTHLEACRRSGAMIHFSERQGSSARPYSGIMLDFDIALGARPEKTAMTLGCGAAPRRVPEVLDARAYRQICSVVTQTLLRDLTVPSGTNGDEFQLQLFFIVRPELTPVAATGGAGATGAATGIAAYKYGFHVLIPGIQTSRGYKKYLIGRLRKNERLMKTLSSVGAIGSPASFSGGGPSLSSEPPLETCLDLGSASVPVLFLGSCKRAGKVYPLGAAFKVQGDLDDIRDGGGFTVAPIPEEQLSAYNMCYELSLWARPPQDVARLAFDQSVPGAAATKAGLVTPRKLSYRAELATTIETMADRLAGALLGQSELQATETEVDELGRRDPDAHYLQQMLSLLDNSFCAEYAKWRNVIFALCNSGQTAGEDYLPLARWFSQRCPEKWVKGGRETLETLWGDSLKGQALKRTCSTWRPLSRRSIIHWASQCSRTRFLELSNNDYYNTLARYVYAHGGVLAHGMVSEVLSKVLNDRFVADVIELSPGKAVYQWFEFVSAGQPMKPGEIWKWRREAHPDEMHKFISNNLVDIAKRIAKEVAEKQKEAKDDVEAKYYKDLGKKLATSITKLYDNPFKNNVVDQSRYLFRRRGFIDSLDADPDIIGVANGILRIASAERPVSQLISGYHEWPVSRFTTVRYRPFDPNEPWTKLLLGAMKQIVPEIDMRVWLMMFLSSGLYHGLKDPIMLFWIGSGRNAKTFAARMAAKVLGDFASKLQISLLTSDREDASKPNSAFMRLKGRGFGYFEESNRCEVLNTSRLKEMVNPGEVTASDKHTKQETFEITATPLSLSNYGFIIDTKDDGTWRRVRHYRSKAKFCPEPDPNNPYEHKDDRRFVREYVNDPECQTAFLSILVFFWERFQKEYNGDIGTVPCLTLDRETEQYRNSQDVLNRFIIERVVVSPEHPNPYPLPEVASRFCDWYQSNIEANSRRYVATEVLGDLENSSLSRFLTTAPNGSRVISGCRILSAREAAEELRPGEEFIGVKGRDAKAKETGGRVFGPHGEPEPDEWWNWALKLETPSNQSCSEADDAGGLPPPEAPCAMVKEAPVINQLVDDKRLADGRLRRAQERAVQKAAQRELDDQVASLLGGGTPAHNATHGAPTIADLGDLIPVC